MRPASTAAAGKVLLHKCPVAEIQSRCMAYSRMHATSSSASSSTSPTHRGLGGATTWRLYSGPHPHESPTPTRIKHNVQQRSPWKQIYMHAMQANKEGVCVHLHASKLQIAKALARVHAQMHLPVKHANVCVYISPRSGLHQATSQLRIFVGSEFCTANMV